jgi:hypothetical protein
MISKLKVLMICLGAMLALSAVWVGAAQAARPVQPMFTVAAGTGCCETIKASVTIEVQSDRSRLWSTGLGTVITCNRDINTINSALEPEGKDKGEDSFKECQVFSAAKNETTKQFEEGEVNAGCVVRSEGAPIGEINTNKLKSKLVWNEGRNEVLVLYEPAEGTVFTTIKIEKAAGKECLFSGTYKVEGGVLAFAARYGGVNSINRNEEGIMGDQLFEVKNENGAVTQLYKNYEVQAVTGGAVTKASVELKLASFQSALESTEQFERPTETNAAGKIRRGLWGVHE